MKARGQNGLENRIPLSISEHIPRDNGMFRSGMLKKAPESVFCFCFEHFIVIVHRCGGLAKRQSV